jgi:hypothetical protein
MKRFRNIHPSFAVAAAAAAAAGVLLIGVAGCAGNGEDKSRAQQSQRDAMPPATTYDEARDFDAAIVRAHQDDFEAAGVIRQHTIYPYHFVADSAALNDLGRRDVAILAGHYASLQVDQGVPPASMGVRRGDASPALYDARVRAVTAELGRGGVPNDRVRIADTVPGGDGMALGKIKVILQRDLDNLPYYDVSEGSGQGTNSGGESGVNAQSGGGTGGAR